MHGMPCAWSREQMISASAGLYTSTAVTTGSSKIGSSTSASPRGGSGTSGTSQSEQVAMPATYSLPQTGQNMNASHLRARDGSQPEPGHSAARSPVADRHPGFHRWHLGPGPDRAGCG